MDASLVKQIEEALELDSSNKYYEAYVKYVECIIQVASCLLHSVTQGQVTSTSVAFRYVQLGQHSFDRISSLLKHLSGTVESKTNLRLTDPAPPLQDEASSHHFSLDRKKTLSPMEIAYKQNQQLMVAYRARISGLKTRDAKTASLSLTIQRKMAENLAIAKAQEEAKMKERQLRLDEQASRRFAALVGISEEEQEQRQIYKKILEYEQEAKWLAEWRHKLNSNPSDTILINQLIQEILRCTDHPLTQLLKTYQFKVYKKLYPLVSQKSDFVKDVVVPLPEYLHPANFKEKASETVMKEKSVDQTENNNICIKAYNNDSVEKVLVSDENKANKFISSGFSIKEIIQEVSGKQSSEESPENNNLKNFENSTFSSKKKETIVGYPDQAVEDSDCKFSEDTSSEGFSCNKIEIQVNESCQTDQEDFVDGYQENKNDIELAMRKGGQLDKQLSSDIEQAQKMLINFSKDYDKYSEENMDDLFEDDDDDDTDGSHKTENTEKSKSDSQHNSLFSDYQPNSCQVTTPSSDTSVTTGQLESPQHSVSQSISELKFSDMSEEAYHQHLKSISQDVHSYMDKLLVMFTIAYEKLDSPAGQDLCYASLEEFFLKNLWKYLLTLYRFANKSKETVLAYYMTVRQDSSPASFGVVDKLCLIDEHCDRIPYQSAIDELCSIKEYYTMLSKLECVVRVCRLVMTCIEDHYKSDPNNSKKSPNVGADDLLPILSYIVIKTCLPQLLSECSAMSEFIHEGYIMGEEGYCLTSLQTAILHIASYRMGKT